MTETLFQFFLISQVRKLANDGILGKSTKLSKDQAHWLKENSRFKPTTTNKIITCINHILKFCEVQKISNANDCITRLELRNVSGIEMFLKGHIKTFSEDMKRKRTQQELYFIAKKIHEREEKISDNLLLLLKDLLGNENVITDLNQRKYFSQDVFDEGKIITAVIQPNNIDQLCKAISIITNTGIPIYPRGGGYSYSNSYLSVTDYGISLDLRKLNKIIEINTKDMFVTVEAGCTWEKLDQELKKYNVRCEFWGPLSGYQSTIGGGISQGAASLGSARDGISAESVLNLDIISANGEIFSTGSSAQKSKSPFFRNYGPDITGMFCGDCGALGIKANITLRLQKRANITQGLSFGFENFNDLLNAMSKISSTNRVTECFGFTSRAMESVMASQGLWKDIKIMFTVGMSSSGFLGGIFQALKMAFYGRRFLNNAQYFAHCVVEGYNKQEIKGHVKTIKDSIKGLGVDLPNTMPTVMRSVPFSPYPVVGVNGTRMLPFHGIMPFSKAFDFHNELEKLLYSYKEDMKLVGMTVPAMFNTISTNGFLYEPVLYWPDKPNIFHEKHTDDKILSRMKNNTENYAGRKLAKKLFNEIVSLMHKKNSVHLQIGKVYPYMLDRSAMNIDLIKSIKNKIDPNNLINPGTLGL